MVRLALRLICVGAAVATVTAAEAQPRERQLPQFDERYYREDDQPEAVEGTTKLCSVYVPGDWRDTIPVPGTWRWRDCSDYAAAVGATHIHLMCVHTRGNPKISIGGPGDLPEPNCGWGRRR
jgi:hypothetical protein